MASIAARLASQEPGLTNPQVVILDAVCTSINYIERACLGVARRLVDQRFQLSQAQLCVIPNSSKTISRAR